MKILFIVDLGTHLGIKPPGIMYLSSSLKRGGHEVRVVDISNSNLDRCVLDYSPHFLAYSTWSGSDEEFLKINNHLKGILNNNVTSIFGGPHPTFFPDFINEEGVDIICRGEGEEAFVELADRVQKGDSYNDIKNLWVKQNSTVIKNDCRPLKDNLDEIPLPDRQPFDEIPGAMHYIEYVINTRGCPFNCSYCFNHQIKDVYGLKQIKVRRRSVDNVISELIGIKKRNNTVQYIQFMEDIFPFEKDWVNEFKIKYLKEINLPFLIHCRANLVKEENIKLLKEAGCQVVNMAVESGTDHVRNDIFKRGMSREALLGAAQIIKKYDLFLQTTNIIGNPVEDSFTDACETIKLNIEMKTDFGIGSLLNPYYGTAIWDYCLQKGYINKDVKFPLTYFLDTPLKLKDKAKILRICELFPIMISFPILFRFRNVLSNMPLRPVYGLLRKLWKGYIYYRHFYKIRFSTRDVLNLSFRYLTGKGNV